MVDVLFDVSTAPCKEGKTIMECNKKLMAANFPEANDTLRRGATEAEINQAEEKLGVKFPLSTRVLYSFCDSQDTLTFDSLHEFSSFGYYRRL